MVARADQDREILLTRQLSLLSLGAEIGVVLTKGKTLGDTLQTCCQSLVKHLDAAFVRIWTVDEGGKVLVLQASAGLYTHLDGKHSRIPIGEQYKIGRIANQKKSILTNTIIGDPQVDQQWARKEGIVAFAGHPLLIEDRVIGVMGLFARRPLSDLTLEALAMVADEIVLGIKRLRAELKLRETNRVLHRTIAALRESEGKLRAIFEAAVDGILVADGRSKKFIAGNRAVCEMLGYSLDELLTLAVANIHPQECLPHVLEQFARQQQRELAVAANIPVKRKDGTVFHADIASAPFTMEDEEYLIGIFRDITEREQAEEQLRQSQKMEAIGTLAGGIAHDFNNILSAIFGYTDLAKEDIKDAARLRQDLDEVRKAALRARDLVSQILTFSRQTKQEKQPVQLSLIVKEALKLLRSSIPASIAIKTEIASTAYVLADPTQMHQIVMNLCANAYHAMREKGGVLSVSLREVERKEDARLRPKIAAGQYLLLAVSDTGHGMDEQIKSRIFDPYFSTKKVGEGTGLGLSVVLGIVQEHYGHITVVSEPGVGTCFSVYLPALQARAAESIKETPAEPIAGGRESIMVVDDEEAIVNIAGRGLTKHGYRATVVSNSSLALREFTKDPGRYDLLITDMTMPEMNGLELIQRIRKIRPNLPVILCTGHSDLVDREKALELGIDEFYQKPIVMSELLGTVRKILDGKPA